jgi:hypothetical protein
MKLVQFSILGVVLQGTWLLAFVLVSRTSFAGLGKPLVITLACLSVALLLWVGVGYANNSTSVCLLPVMLGGWLTFDFFKLAPPQLRLPHLSRFSKGAHSSADSWRLFLRAPRIVSEVMNPYTRAFFPTPSTRHSSIPPVEFRIGEMFLSSSGSIQATGRIFISAVTNSFTSTGPLSPRR